MGVEDLLGRDPVPPHLDLLTRNIQGKSVLITGAGGSIGSELTRQMLNLGAERIVLFDLSEIALYKIEMELRDRLKDMAGTGNLGSVAKPPQINAVLGSVNDRSLVMQTLKDNRTQTIYHAAAYKHVPMVEANPVSGLMNNTYGTRVLAECALERDLTTGVPMY